MIQFIALAVLIAPMIAQAQSPSREELLALRERQVAAIGWKVHEYETRSQFNALFREAGLQESVDSEMGRAFAEGRKPPISSGDARAGIRILPRAVYYVDERKALREAVTALESTEASLRRMGVELPPRIYNRPIARAMAIPQHVAFIQERHAKELTDLLYGPKPDLPEEIVRARRARIYHTLNRGLRNSAAKFLGALAVIPVALKATELAKPSESPAPSSSTLGSGGLIPR